MRLRTVPSLPTPVSEIGVSLDTADGGPALGRLPEGALAPALRAGVSLFHLTDPDEATLRALRHRLEADPAPEGYTILVCLKDGATTASGPGLADLAARESRKSAIREMTTDSVAFAFEAPAPVITNPVSPERSPRETRSVGAGAPPDEGLFFRGELPSDLPGVAATSGDARWVDVACDIANTDRLVGLDALLSGTGWKAIVRDPFAGGRLDGGRLLSPPLLASPSAPPPDLERLEREYAPVLRLSALTRERRRTLPQAAVQLLLDRPWCAAVLLGTDSASRLADLGAIESLPEVTEAERELVLPRGGGAPVDSRAAERRGT